MNLLSSFPIINPDIYLSFRDSGVRDFGEEGITTFLRDHRCNNICKLLWLHTDVPLHLGNKAKPAIPKGKWKGKEKAKPTSHDSDDEESSDVPNIDEE